jgi:hypothetical protein
MVKMPKELREHLKDMRDKSGLNNDSKRDDRMYDHISKVIARFCNGVLNLLGRFGPGGMVVRRNEPAENNDEDNDNNKSAEPESRGHRPHKPTQPGRGPSKPNEALKRGFVEVRIDVMDSYEAGTKFVEFFADCKEPSCRIQLQHDGCQKIMKVIMDLLPNVSPVMITKSLVTFMKKRINEAYVVALFETNEHCLANGITDLNELFRLVAARLNPVLSDMFLLNPQTTIDLMATSLGTAEREARKDMAACVEAEIDAA